MGKTVIAEETVSDYISLLYGAHQWQIGLIIGQITGQRDYIVHLARTPDQTDSGGISSEEGQRNEGKKPRSLEQVDDKWAVEHAHQVGRMLCGGLDVIGVFAFGPPDMLSRAQGKIRRLVYSVYKTTCINTAAFFDANDLVHSMIVLQICSQTKKITCRTLDTSDAKSTAQPAELKFQSFVNRWTRLETQLFLDLEFNVPYKLDKASLHTKIMNGLESSLQSITSSVCTINGTLLPHNQLLVPAEKQTKSSHQAGKSSQSIKVEVYLDKSCESADTKTKERETVGTISVRGDLHCKACVNQKATIRDAIQAIKYDAVRSILSRVDVLCEDILDSQEQQPREPTESTWTCPKRVFVPLGKSPVKVCDFLFQDETIQDSVDRMSELLDIKPTEEDVESCEVIPTHHQVQEIAALMRAQGKETEKTSTQEMSHAAKQNSSHGTLLGAMLGLVTALVAAGMAFIWGEQT